MVQMPDNVACLAGQQTWLQGDKGDGVSGLNNRAGRRAGLGVQPGGNIQRDNRCREGVSPLNQIREVLARCAL